MASVATDPVKILIGVATRVLSSGREGGGGGGGEGGSFPPKRSSFPPKRLCE